MPRPFLTLLLFFAASTSFAQYFSGELHYETTFKAKKPNVNLDSLRAAAIAPSSTYVITDGYYKSVSERGKCGGMCGAKNPDVTEHKKSRRRILLA